MNSIVAQTPEPFNIQASLERLALELDLSIEEVRAYPRTDQDFPRLHRLRVCRQAVKECLDGERGAR